MPFYDHGFWTDSTDVSGQHEFNRKIIEEFRASAGEVGGQFAGEVGGQFAGRPVILLYSKGAKSGLLRVNPMSAQVLDDGTFCVFASNSGGPRHPDWYHNVVANPVVEVEYKTNRFRAMATTLTGAEREVIWERQKRLVPRFADLEKMTSRTIPVVSLTRF